MRDTLIAAVLVAAVAAVAAVASVTPPRGRPAPSDEAEHLRRQVVTLTNERDLLRVQCWRLICADPETPDDVRSDLEQRAEIVEQCVRWRNTLK